MNRLILAGGGHAHLHVLKSLARRRWPDVEVVLLTPYARQIYSGMVPGWMAGHYALDQCAASLHQLSSAAGVSLQLASLTAINADTRTLETSAGTMLDYDVLSVDTGANVDVSCLAASGVRSLSVRPLEQFVVDWCSLLEAARQQGRWRLAVVGGGAAGVELALAAQYRLAKEIGHTNVSVTVVSGSPLLPGHGIRIREHVSTCLGERGIAVVKARAAGSPNGLLLDDGTALEVDAVIAATGVQPPAWLRRSGLALAMDGFIAVGEGQQSTSHSNVFAGGDIASRVDHPHAKSGVYAVRSGPVLANNLQRALQGQSPLPYTPQRRSLYLLATGPKDAILSWNGLTARAGWIWRWKNWIDQRFMRQYRLNTPSARGEQHGAS